MQWRISANFTIFCDSPNVCVCVKKILVCVPFPHKTWLFLCVSLISEGCGKDNRRHVSALTQTFRPMLCLHCDKQIHCMGNAFCVITESICHLTSETQQVYTLLDSCLVHTSRQLSLLPDSTAELPLTLDDLPHGKHNLGARGK